jgi:hypothetical protein
MRQPARPDGPIAGPGCPPAVRRIAIFLSSVCCAEITCALQSPARKSEEPAMSEWPPVLKNTGPAREGTKPRCLCQPAFMSPCHKNIMATALIRGCD